MTLFLLLMGVDQYVLYLILIVTKCFTDQVFLYYFCIKVVKAIILVLF